MEKKHCLCLRLRLLFSLWASAVLLAAATTLSREPLVAPPWVVDTFVDLENADGDWVLAELRHHCCHSVKDTSASFCREFEIPTLDCERLEQFLHQASSAAPACGECPAHRNNEELTATDSAIVATKLATVKLKVVHSTDFSKRIVNLAVYNGDYAKVDDRVDAACMRFELDVVACASLRELLREKATALEVNATKQRLLDGRISVEDAFGVIEKVNQSLLQRNKELRRRLHEKAEALRRLHFQAQDESHRLARRVRELEQALKNQTLETSGHLTASAGAVSPESQNATPSPLQSVVFSPISRRIARVHVANFSYAQYLEYARGSTPVIIQGLDAVVGSPGLPRWSLSRLNETCGDAQVTLKKAANNPLKHTQSSMWAGIQPVTKTRLRDFLNDFTATNASQKTWPAGLADLYLHDASVRDFCPQLLAEFTIPRYFVSDYLQTISHSKQRDYWPSLFIGDAGTASALHADWASTAAWMGLLAGRKHWAIAKPSARAALYEIFPTREAPSQGRFEGSLLNGSHGTHLLRPGEVFEDVLEAGEVLFIPADCPHQVQNLEKTIAVAANYVDSANVNAFRGHLRFQKHASSEGYATYARMLDEVDIVGNLDPALEPPDLLFPQFKARYA